MRAAIELGCTPPTRRFRFGASGSGVSDVVANTRRRFRVVPRPSLRFTLARLHPRATARGLSLPRRGHPPPSPEQVSLPEGVPRSTIAQRATHRLMPPPVQARAVRRSRACFGGGGPNVESQWSLRISSSHGRDRVGRRSCVGEGRPRSPGYRMGDHRPAKRIRQPASRSTVADAVAPSVREPSAPVAGHRHPIPPVLYRGRPQPLGALDDALPTRNFQRA